MSTARTAIGCMAEDYGKELQEIVRLWLAQVPRVPLPDDAQRLVDVAESFVRCSTGASA